MTIAVLGIDALDYGLATEWNCDNILLENYRRLETGTHSLDIPATIEVWPTIATGQRPSEHGVLLNAPDRDDGTALSLARQFIELLPSTLRRQIISVKNWRTNESNYPTTDSEHIFDNGTVKNWPGVTPCEDWATAGQWFTAFTDGNMSPTEFRSRYLRQTGEQFGWLVGATKANESIAGVHVHMLDHMGHAYAERPDTLREYYEVVDELVGMIREMIPNLLILSDHGMQTVATGDDDPGVHSRRALISSSMDGELPESIYEVRSWLEQHIGAESRTAASGVDAPREHLEDLGYL